MGAPDLIVPGTASGTGPVGGTGTTNTIPRWTGPSTLGDSVITQSGGNVGIGTASPQESLQVNAGFRVSGAANVATAASAGPGVFSYEYPFMRTYVGDGTGYAWALSRRGGSVTTDLMYIGDTYGSLFVPGADCYFYGVRVGRGAGAQATNTAVGANALNANTTGFGNTALGIGALNANTSGQQNTAIGNGALNFATTGSYLTAVGVAAGYGQAGSTQTAATYVGAFAAYAITSGQQNVLIGHDSGNTITTGSFNTVLGGRAGNGLTSGSNNVYLGSDTAPSANNVTNELVVGYSVTGAGSNTTTIGNASTTRTVLPGGVLQVAAGTAGAPAYTTAGDLDTGIYFSGANAVSFAEGGAGYRIGYRNVPAVGTKTGSYTLSTADVGKYVQVGAGGSITIPDATFAEGDIVTIFNNTSGNVTITCSITTAYISGANSDLATMTLATRGVATIFFVSGTVCVVSGAVS